MASLAQANGAVRGGARKVARRARAASARADKAIARGVDDAADFIVKGARDMTARGQEAGNWFARLFSSARGQVQERPLQTLAVTAGVSALLGYLLLRR